MYAPPCFVRRLVVLHSPMSSTAVPDMCCSGPTLWGRRGWAFERFQARELGIGRRELEKGVDGVGFNRGWDRGRRWRRFGVSKGANDPCAQLQFWLWFPHKPSLSNSRISLIRLMDLRSILQLSWQHLWWLATTNQAWRSTVVDRYCFSCSRGFTKDGMEKHSKLVHHDEAYQCL
ncbi:hypothetical protein RHSIM_Rhsim02G0226900 [Rhododendron simsii]|uniref:Uncharacterized protein n=1 Tax=Rhododendron simsii TaxID=118357 RepID=A0A834H9E3_RHOSS|nr:hypothetical protein RHSIM_Rhsim02G0226900 [Rhododendron simsii]